MKTEKLGLLLILAAGVLLSGCASLRSSGGKYRYRFASDRTGSNAKVISRREAYTSIHFETDPPGASIYAYDQSKAKKADYLGKTPFDYNALCYSINDYADLTKGYSVDICVPYEITREIDYADPQNTTGEIAFSFYCEKKGFKPGIEHVKVKATHEDLLKALEGSPLPAYNLKTTLEAE